jgi:hypothetical protein
VRVVVAKTGIGGGKWGDHLGPGNDHRIRTEESLNWLPDNKTAQNDRTGLPKKSKKESA